MLQAGLAWSVGKAMLDVHPGRPPVPRNNTSLGQSTTISSLL
jgi:hypothetical protein